MPLSLAAWQAEIPKDTPEQRLEALNILRTLPLSAAELELAVRLLERLALDDPSPQVQQAALHALSSSPYRGAQRGLAELDEPARRLLGAQIERLAQENLLPERLAAVLRGRYALADEPAPELEPLVAPAQPEAVAGLPAEVAESVETPVGAGLRPVPAPAEPAAPPASGLGQLLLSDTSIKIALYLGAFFVVAAAFILAALVEVARLPILGVTTALFLGAAVALNRRLPQASFVLFAVGTLLLPIDAGVLENLLDLLHPGEYFFWAVIAAVCATAWVGGAVLYRSRLFSVLAFLGFALAVIQATLGFELNGYSALFWLALTGLGGLLAAYWLAGQEQKRLAAPLFWTVQVYQAVLFFILATALLSWAFNVEALVEVNPPYLWLASSLTWLVGAVFYELSGRTLRRMGNDLPFEILSVFCVATAPLTALGVFSLGYQVYLPLMWGWGILLGIAGEAAGAPRLAGGQPYRAWLFLDGGLVFAVALIVALARHATEMAIVFLLASFALYLILTLRRLRWFFWTAALGSAFLAYWLLGDLLDQQRLVYFLPALALLGLALLGERRELGPGWVRPALGFAAFAGWLDLLGYMPWVTGGLARLVNPLADYPIRFTGAQEILAALAYVLALALYMYWLPAGRRRGLFWSAALSSGVWAYLLLFYLPPVAALDIPPVYIFTPPALALLTLDLLGRQRGVGRQWTLPALILGLGCAALNLLLAAQIWVLWQINWLAPAGLPAHSASTGLAPDALLHGAVVLLVYAVYGVGFALEDERPWIGYFSAASLAGSLVFLLDLARASSYILPLAVLAGVYYGASLFLRWRASRTPAAPAAGTATDKAATPGEAETPGEAGAVAAPPEPAPAADWGDVLQTSGLALGALVGLAALFSGNAAAVLGETIIATCFAVEALRQRNVWLGYPTNFFYFIAYTLALRLLNVSEPQVFTIAAALLGIIMHYLLVRADPQRVHGSAWAAFITGLLAQLILLSTTYFQMVGSEQLRFFFLIFFQGLALLVYGLVVRSRSFVFVPVGFLILSVITVALSVLSGVPTALIIGCTGFLLLALGILALALRQRLLEATEAWMERLNNW